MNNYFRWINLSRGIGIFLVVFGHAISDTLYSSSLFYHMFWFVYSFHMPLFFFISGFCGAKVLNKVTLKDKMNYVEERFKRLIIPYIFVGLFYIPIKLIMADYITKQVNINDIIFGFMTGDNPNSQLWTLYVLFIEALIIALFANNRSYFTKVLFVASLIIGLLSTLLPTGILQNIMLEFFFYSLGCISRKENLEKYLTSWKLGIISLVILILINIFIEIHGDNILKIITGVLGITVVCSFSYLIQNRYVSFVDALGLYSMDIYIMANIFQVGIRTVFLNKLQFPGEMCCIFSVFSGIALPIILSKYFLRRFAITKAVILGNFNQKNLFHEDNLQKVS